MSERDEAFARLEAAVAELDGLTITDIRQLFQREGAKGHRVSHCKCPTAVFLSQRVGAKVSVTSRNAALMSDLGEGDEIARRSVPLPEPVQWFVRWFDSGQYTELEER